MQAKLLWKEALLELAASSEDEIENTIPAFTLSAKNFGQLNCTIDTYQNSQAIDFPGESSNKLYAKIDYQDYWGSSLVFKVFAWLKTDKPFQLSHILGWGYNDALASENKALLPKFLLNSEIKYVSDGIYSGFLISDDNLKITFNDISSLKTYDYIICINDKSTSYLLVLNNLVETPEFKGQIVYLNSTCVFGINQKKNKAV